MVQSVNRRVFSGNRTRHGAVAAVRAPLKGASCDLDFRAVIFASDEFDRLLQGTFLLRGRSFSLSQFLLLWFCPRILTLEDSKRQPPSPI
jgi:hypothetical protein